MRWTLLFTVLWICLIGCVSNFTRVDFKYSNAAHMNYKNAMVKLTGSPENIVFTLSESFRNSGAEIRERKKLDYILLEAEKGQECWEALVDVFNQEFASYRENNFNKYKSIDRNDCFTKRGVFPGCRWLYESSSENAESWLLSVELDPRAGATQIYTPTVNNFIVFDGTNIIHGGTLGQRSSTITTSFQTLLKFWIWREQGEKKSTIYMEAFPINNGIVAHPGASIGYQWWPQTNGYHESKIVKNYSMFFEEIERKSIILENRHNREMRKNGL